MFFRDIYEYRKYKSNFPLEELCEWEVPIKLIDATRVNLNLKIPFLIDNNVYLTETVPIQYVPNPTFSELKIDNCYVLRIYKYPFKEKEYEFVYNINLQIPTSIKFKHR